MIETTKLDSVGMVVRDLEYSLAWYKDKFGFTHLYDVDNGVVIGSGEISLWLAQASDPAHATAPNHARDICIRLIAFEVPAAELENVMHEFSEDEVVEIEHDNYDSCIIQDPDGHAIELIAHR